MQIGLRFGGETSFLQVEALSSISLLRKSVCSIFGINSDAIALLHNANVLEGFKTIAAYGIQNLDIVQACPKVLGGGGNMSENDKALALHQRVTSKMICRGCYARCAIKASICRKCQCSDLRCKKDAKNTTSKK
jgi:large subunit ribosomal protein L40e